MAMRIGVPTEIKSNERRVGLTPEAVRELVQRGHAVTVQSGAGLGIGADDDVYAARGADIAPAAAEVFGSCELIVKVKEPQESERRQLRPSQTLFAYLHLAPDPQQTAELCASGVTAIAYETVTGPAGTLPLLAPMSQIAGRLSVQFAASALEAPNGGPGVLLSGVPGVPPARVVVLGGGVVGENATRIAVGMGARVAVLDRSFAVLDRLDRRFGTTITTEFSSHSTIDHAVAEADVVIGAVLVKGDRAPMLVDRQHLATMRRGSVLVDVSIDQGGCFETSRPTTYDDPIYEVDGIRHFCVANMPGAVPRTSTYALSHATLPYVVAIAEQGARAAMLDDPDLLAGLNVHDGHVTEPAVAHSQGLAFVPPAEALGG
ncbi:MAG TPA: alanine dehydrogenase [Acidimicrobiales bacterium]